MVSTLNKDEETIADEDRLDFFLRRVKAANHAKRSTQTKKKNYKSETLRNMDESKPITKSDRCGAYLCNYTKPNFVEYWVPVGLSEMQIEQYCGTLFSKADILGSRSKHDHSILLDDILVSLLVSTKKCCDHPYLVDGSLCTSLIRDIPKPQLLDAELKMSNKLLLLHKILLEIRKRGLRVLILYQSLGDSKPFSTGDLLDEIIHQIFGRDLSVRIGGRGRISRSKRRAALNTFNDRENGKFICLMETDSCIPSIKLASIDVVILFNSDWNPMNDSRALQKIHLDSQFERVKVFRMYSPYTLEEKILILAKQGVPLEGYVSDIKRNTCHQLLSWGASYLFEKLDELHGGKSVTSVEDSLENVFAELSVLLPNKESSADVRTDENEKSDIVEVQQVGGVYPGDISLLGEVGKNIPFVEKMTILKKPRVFWKKLFEGRNPRWEYFPSRSRRVKKSIKRFDDLVEEAPAPKKRREEVRRSVYQIPSNIKRKIRSKLQNRIKMRENGSAINETRVSHTSEASCVASQFVCKALRAELEGLQKQKSELLKLHEEKKLQTRMACEKEIDQIRKKYDTLLQNVETALLEEKQIIEAKYSKVYINKSLAEAVMERDTTENLIFPQVTSNCSTEEMYQRFFGSNTVTRPEQVDKNPFQTLRNPVTPSDVASCLLIGQSNFNITNPTACSMPVAPYNFSGNVRSGYLVRAPAPHLRRTRPPQPITGPKLSYPGPGIFQPVNLRTVTYNLQTTGSDLWSLSHVAGLPL